MRFYHDSKLRKLTCTDLAREQTGMHTSQSTSLTLQQRRARSRARKRGRVRKAWIISIIMHGCIVVVGSVLLSAQWNHTAKAPFTWKVRLVEAKPVEPPEQTPPQEPAPKKGVMDTAPPPQPLAQVNRNSERKLRAVESRAAQQGPRQTESTRPEMEHSTAAQSAIMSRETPAPRRVFSMLGKVAPSFVQARSLATRSTAVDPQRYRAHPDVTRPQSAKTTGQKTRRAGIRHPSQEQQDFSVKGKEVIAPQADPRVFHEAPVRAPEHRQEEDLGWLTTTLYKKIQTVKRYPRRARLQGMEGRVVVRTTIKNDGGLADLGVEKPSGYRLLDLDALETVRRAFPLDLDQDISRSRVIILLPIVYTLKT